LRRIKRYQEIIKAGNFECPKQIPTIGSGKKVRQTKELNLLDLLCEY
jgi:hypothetical protein